MTARHTETRPAKRAAKSTARRKAASEGTTLRTILTRQLLPYQRAWFESARQHRFLCGCWARQTGKSFTTALVVAVSLVTVAGVQWMIAAPSERQSQESLEKVKNWIRALGVFFAEDVDALADPEIKAASIRLNNGSRVISVPGRPDTVRGMSCNVWLDEFAFFDDPDATWKAILPSITNPLSGGMKGVIITSTPNGREGQGRRFHGICTSPARGKITWQVHTFTLPDCIRAGLPVDYQELADALDDPLAIAQELNCEFLDSSNVLLPYELIAQAESPDASAAGDADLFRHAAARDLRCGIDFGRTNDPTVCWTMERTAGGTWITREILVLKNMPTDKQEQILSRRIAAARRTALDYTGPGIGLGDYLVKTHGRYNPASHEFGKVELCTFTPAFKRSLFPRLRRAFESPVSIRIPADPELRDDLHAMQQIVHNGEFSYAAPRTKDGHSDRCTALALALHAAQGPAGSTSFGILGPGRLGSNLLQASRRRPILTASARQRFS